MVLAHLTLPTPKGCVGQGKAQSPALVVTWEAKKPALALGRVDSSEQTARPWQCRKELFTLLLKATSTVEDQWKSSTGAVPLCSNKQEDNSFDSDHSGADDG